MNYGLNSLNARLSTYCFFGVYRVAVTFFLVFLTYCFLAYLLESCQTSVIELYCVGAKHQILTAFSFAL